MNVFTNALWVAGKMGKTEGTQAVNYNRSNIEE